MSELAGVYDRHLDAVQVGRILQGMQRALAAPGRIAEPVASAGAGCCTVARPGGDTHVAHDRTRGVWLVFAGELNNAAELRAQLEPGFDATPLTSAELCLALWHREGEGFVRRLNGPFNVVIGRMTDRSLRVISDRYGSRPLFVSETGGRLLFATQMKAILAVRGGRPEADGIGVMWLAGSGCLFGDRTWVDGIRVVDPGTIVEIGEHAVIRKRYFSLRFGSATRPGSADAFADELATVLVAAAARATRPTERVGVTLSGGLDSRTTLLALSRHRPPAATCTFGTPDSRDARSARALAAAIGVRHLQLPYATRYLDRVLLPVVWRTEGLVPFASTQYTSLHFHERMAEWMDVVFYGHCGDTLTGRHLHPSLLLARSRRQLGERILRRYRACPAATLRRICHPRFLREHARPAEDEVRRGIAAIDAERAADVIDVWNMEHHQRRAPFHSAALDRDRFAVRTLFLDNAVVDHLLQAPPRWRLEQIAYKRMIVRAFPEAAHVPWAYTGRRLRSRLSADVADVGRYYVATRLRRGVPSPGSLFRDLTADTRAALGVAAAIRTFTSSDYFPDQLFDRAGIDDIVDRHWRGEEDHTHAVVMLATFAATWRVFVAEQPTSPADRFAPNR